MCNYVAIAETKSPAESLRKLVLHTLLTFEEEKASSVQDVADILKTMFGVEAPNHQVQEALDQLTSDGQVYKPMGTNYVLTPEARAKVKLRIEQASELQDRVKMQWMAEMIRRFPDVDAELAWAALQDYLAKAFVRHGIQVVVFLDPAVELPTEHATSLSTLLAEVVKARFDLSYREGARHAISDFLAKAGEYPERAQFIAECADGAANYFSLSVSPEVAVRFREKLSPFMLFCDTNFLFGVLDLHVHPLVEVSHKLLDVIAQHKLPIELRYHEATLQELQVSISRYGDMLRRNKWPQALSRAATTSPFMSGIELKYHKKNAETGIDVDAFLRPYQHVDVLLNERQIIVYRPPTDRLTERATLETEYKDFLTRLPKEKPYELIAHDVAVLDCVRSFRSNAQSTIEAGALLVTCDYALYRFDSKASRNAKSLASVVLPNVLWQILRPFIPASKDFDRSFAETFAIPEFRTIGSGASRACSKMLALLAAYKDFREETAARLLSNDMLIDQLRSAENDEQFHAQVESAIATENQALLEERAALARRVEVLESEKSRAEKELEEKKKAEAEIAAKVKDKEEEVERLSTSKSDAEAKAKNVFSKLKEIEAAKGVAEKATMQEAEARKKAERAAHLYAVVAALGVSTVLIIGFEMLVYGLPWNWLKNHTNSFGLQAGVSGAIISFMLGLFRPRWRKVWWLVILIALAAVIITLVGGPSSLGTPTPKAP
jgi:chaperonin cofactor prefoldin